MKLTDLSSHGFEGCLPIRLNQLDPGLNVIWASTENHLSSLCRFVGSILYGRSSESTHMLDAARRGGYVNVEANGERFQLCRESETYRDDLRVTGLSSAKQTEFPRQLLSTLDRHSYETLFMAISGTGRRRTESLLRAILEHFDQTNDSRWFSTDDGGRKDFNGWQLLAEERRRQLQQLEEDIRRLESDRERRASEIQSRIHQVDHGDVERQLHSVRRELNQLRDDLSAHVSEADALNRQITDLDRQIQSCLSGSTENSESVTEWMRAAQRTLDEIDHQLSQWGQLQAGIQDERLRLRDEMSNSSEMELSQEEHPYHQVRELITALDQKLGRTENLGTQWGRMNEPAEDAKRLSQFCADMRNDLEALCAELAKQYRHVRHRAAVAELKQLRRCYREMEQNIDRLEARRQDLVDSIRRRDPAGAQAVAQGTAELVEWADRHGYYEARQSHSADSSCAFDERRAPPDTADKLIQRDELLRRKSETDRRIQASRQQIEELEGREKRLLGDLEMSRRQDVERQRQEHATIESQLLAKQDDHRLLSQLVAEDRKRLENLPYYALFELASNWLVKLSSGVLTEVRPNARDGLCVIDDRGQKRPAASLRDEDLDEINLALVMACVSRFARQGVHLPMILRHDGIADSNRHVTLQVLHEFAREGHQVLWLTSNPRIAEQGRGAGHSTFELADTSVTNPTNYPDLTKIPRNEIVDDDARYYPMRYTNMDHTPIITTMHSAEMSYDPTGAIIEESTRIRSIDLVESIYLNPLSSCGIQTVDDLLSIDLAKMDDELIRRGFKPEQIARWQYQACLLLCIPHLDTVDARVLVASGIEDPWQMMELDEQQILSRIGEYFTTPAAKRDNVSPSRFDRRRIALWTNYLKRNSTWQIRYRPSRWSPRATDSNEAPGNGRLRNDTPLMQDRVSGHPRQGERQNRETAIAAPERDGNAESEMRGAVQKGSADGERKYRFYLKKTDEIIDAPSIGPKSAEYFIDAGVQSIADFLDAIPEDLAKKINQRRMSAKAIRLWQRQVRLMCQVPNLRGHDAQLLVAIDIDDINQLANMNPQSLLEQVQPFAESKEGQRILRNSTPPDLDEVTEWIESARYSRDLMAA